MNYLIVGAGNASRPVARFLNYKGENVTITDIKPLNEFKERIQNKLLEMEEEGVTLDLDNQNPSLEEFDKVFTPPTLPNTAPIAIEIANSNVDILTNTEFSKMVDDDIPIDIIGISGTMGKTTTTFVTDFLFKKSGYNVWFCSSLTQNLVSETIVDGVVTGKAKECDIAIFELPHGTMGLLNNLTLKIGLLTNIGIDHLSEFGGSLEKYHERKMVLQQMSKTLISNTSCQDFIEPVRDDSLYYAIDEDCDFKGTIGDKSLTIKYKNGEFTAPFYMKSYYFENSLAASAIALTYGIQEEDIIKALSEFKGLPGHLEDFGIWNGRQVINDAAFLYDGIKATLETFKDDNVVLFIDFFDTTTKRDKKEVGKLLNEYVDIVIASSFNEETQQVEKETTQEILDAMENPNAIKIAVDDLDDAAALCFKYSKPGDIILHIGPLYSYDRVMVDNKILKGLKKGSKQYE